MSTTHPQISCVQQWHNALNSNDKTKLAALVKDNVKIGGPRGSVEGVEIMLEWVDRAKVSLTPQRFFQQDDIIVVEELGEWHSPETGEVISSQVVATIFIMSDYLIDSLSRYGSLQEAFEVSGLHENNKVRI